MKVFGRIVVEGAPGAKVVLSELHTLNIYVFSFLHHGEIDGNTHAAGEVLGDEVHFGRSAEEACAFVEYSGHIRCIGAEGIND